MAGGEENCLVKSLHSPLDLPKSLPRTKRSLSGDCFFVGFNAGDVGFNTGETWASPTPRMKILQEN